MRSGARSPGPEAPWWGTPDSHDGEIDVQYPLLHAVMISHVLDTEYESLVQMMLMLGLGGKASIQASWH